MNYFLSNFTMCQYVNKWHIKLLEPLLVQSQRLHKITGMMELERCTITKIAVLRKPQWTLWPCLLLKNYLGWSDLNAWLKKSQLDFEIGEVSNPVQSSLKSVIENYILHLFFKAWNYVCFAPIYNEEIVDHIKERTHFCNSAHLPDDEDKMKLFVFKVGLLHLRCF